MLLFHHLEWQFKMAIRLFAWKTKDLSIIQVGSNDGYTIDPLHQIIKRPLTNALVVEAVPYLFEKLKKTYNGLIGVKPINMAITSDATIKEVPFYYFKAIPGKPFDECLTWWGSLSKEYSEKYTTDNPLLQELLVCESLPCTTLNDLYKTAGFNKLDILHTDVEGLDGELINSFDLSVVKPALIVFEHYHLTKREAEAIIKRLSQIGYRCYSNGHDTLCFWSSKWLPDAMLRFIKWLRPSLLSPVK